jgi:hypothetical protein
MSSDRRAWGSLGSVMIALLALVWLAPAARAGGEADIQLGQTVLGSVDSPGSDLVRVHFTAVQGTLVTRPRGHNPSDRAELLDPEVRDPGLGRLRVRDRRKLRKRILPGQDPGALPAAPLLQRRLPGRRDAGVRRDARKPIAGPRRSRWRIGLRTGHRLRGRRGRRARPGRFIGRGRLRPLRRRRLYRRRTHHPEPRWHGLGRL